MAYTHQHAKGASVQNHHKYPVFAESNWENDGPEKNCMKNGNKNLGETIYYDFEILDPTSDLSKAGEEEMQCILAEENDFTGNLCPWDTTKPRATSKSTPSNMQLIKRIYCN